MLIGNDVTATLLTQALPPVGCVLPEELKDEHKFVADMKDVMVKSS